MYLNTNIIQGVKILWNNIFLNKLDVQVYFVSKINIWLLRIFKMSHFMAQMLNLSYGRFRIYYFLNESGLEKFKLQTESDNRITQRANYKLGTTAGLNCLLAT